MGTLLHVMFYALLVAGLLNGGGPIAVLLGALLGLVYAAGGVEGPGNEEGAGNSAIAPEGHGKTSHTDAGRLART